MVTKAGIARFIPWVVAIFGAVVGVFSLVAARHADTASWAGRQTVPDIVLVAAGWALIGAGLRLANRSAQHAAGRLLTVAGFAWFAADWNNQFTSSSVMFTAGVAFGTVAPVLIGHAALRYASPLRPLGRVAITLGYAATLLIAGVLPALFLDPGAQSCADCAANVIALQSVPTIVEALGRAAVVIGPLWCGLMVVAIGRELVVAGPGRRRLDAPVLLPAVGYLGAVCATYLLDAGSSYLSIDASTRLLWTVQGALLTLMSFGTGWPAVQRRVARARMARLVVELAGTPAPGGLRGRIAASMHDPGFAVLYPLTGDLLVDAAGRSAQPGPGQAVTRVVRAGEAVALLAHRPGLLGDPQTAAEISAAASLAIDNERLQAQTRARLTDLRESRARIVRTGDAERRRLERDLHDGAQQQLVALSLALALAAIRNAADEQAVDRLNRARFEVTDALAHLRTLARGIYPRELADEGLSAALATLTEGSTVPLSINAVPAGRLPHEVEAAAYQVVSRLLQSSGTAGATLAVTAGTDRLRIDMEVNLDTEPEPAGITALQDRVGALGGQLTVQRNPTGVSIAAVLPCG
jgi:signal transduction histidine kinase